MPDPIDPPAAQPLRRRQRQTERMVAAMHAAIAPAVGDAVRRAAAATPDGPRLDAIGRLQVLAVVDAELDRIYGRERGGPSPLEDVTVAEANAARAAAVAQAVAQVRRRLPGRRGAALRAAIGDPDAPADG